MSVSRPLDGTTTTKTPAQTPLSIFAARRHGAQAEHQPVQLCHVELRVDFGALYDQASVSGQSIVAGSVVMHVRACLTTVGSMAEISTARRPS
jgi:hypothetical protein